MIVNVTGFTFTPIHDFVPRKQKNDYASGTGIMTNFGDQRYIALENDSRNNNYSGTNENLNYLNNELENNN